MNIREISKICGVSPATISRVINGGAPVNAATRKRIEDAILQHGYKPNPAHLKSKTRSGTVGVLLPSLNHVFFQRVLDVIDVFLMQQGKYMVVFPERIPNALQRIQAMPLDGIILLCEETDSETIRQLYRMGLATVMCGALSLSKSCPAVHVDDLAAAYDGVNYLLGLGHRKIGIISDSPRSISSGFQRIAGCRKAMEDYGLPFRDECVFSQGSDYKCGYDGAKKLMARNPDITAIFAHSDASAVGAMSALIDLGLKIPQDVSLLGFDDTGLGEQIRPRLTCVHQPIEDIVSKTLELLFESMEHPDMQSPPSITLPHSITARESCWAIDSLKSPV